MIKICLLDLFYESLQFKIKFIWKLMSSHLRPLGGATLSGLGISAVRYKRHVGLKQIQCYFSDMDSNKKKDKDRKDGKKNNPGVRCLATGSFQGILLVSSDVVVCPYPPPTTHPDSLHAFKEKAVTHTWMGWIV